MNDIRLRLLALERGEKIQNPPTIEEIQEALFQRIGDRIAATLVVTEKIAKKAPKKPAAPTSGLELD